MNKYLLAVNAPRRSCFGGSLRDNNRSFSDLQMEYDFCSADIRGLIRCMHH